MQTRSLRIAILSSLGLLPLGCFAGDARDVDSGEVTNGNESGAGGGSTDQPDDTGEPTNPPQAPEPVDAPACGDSVPVAQDEIGQNVYGYTLPTAPGVATGIYRCDGGLLHRPEPTVCESRLPRPLPPEPEPGMPALTQVELLYDVELSSTSTTLCTADADCTERPYGYCAPTYLGAMGGTRPYCNYGCVADADCGEGFLCQCGDPLGQCVAATCRSDQDCGGDLKCGQWESDFACWTDVTYTCQTEADTCNTTADCGEREYCSGEGGTRRCVRERGLECGRPFLVAGEARTAALHASSDWSSAVGVARPALAAAERLLIGEHWARAALMEHASIAAFARFTLQLLHLGAPRELIEQSQQAMLDETEHAKQCFTLASRYLDCAVGPGALPMDDALEQNDLASVTLMAFLEGCVGETVATLEAQAALERASDPLVRSTLERIAEDEQRHAELAWQFVRWALSIDGSLAGSLAVQLARLEQELTDSVRGQGEHASAAHGVLSAIERARVRHSALSQVVLPCGRALLASSCNERTRPFFAAASA